MASAVVVSPDPSQDKSSRFHLLTWINTLLKTNFKDVREIGSGESLVWADIQYKTTVLQSFCYLCLNLFGLELNGHGCSQLGVISSLLLEK